MADSDPHLKLIDFGLSKVCHKGARMTTFCGTAAFFAPEELTECYDHRCDLWALGVIVYMLLFGQHPFLDYKNPLLSAKQAAKTFENIGAGRYRLLHPISRAATDFLESCLDVDPERRTSAEDLVDHKWIKSFDNGADSPLLDAEVLAGMRAYASGGAFKRAALKLVSLSMPTKDLAELRKAFECMDTGRQGAITLQEFQQALSKIDSSANTQEEYAAIFKLLDLNQSQTIQYSEFLAACIQTKFELADYQELLRDVFRKFDKDNSGAITAANLREILGEEYNNSQVADLIAECDQRKSGQIEFDEFMSYLSGHAANGTKCDGLFSIATNVELEDDVPGHDGVKALL
eukprot:gnl/TRDRNA2_/TRDRNA2_156748_c0_seq1.p1 gnl/TRDRNA2_/TRDRNA2_156748_c0~~gnl/TRDRNA2_/TRDRNA2_156748_c0_seq1.p1  ORF type:complete len:347 (-),score=61.65 gnl/TRDRNA2_/TRDRNA2_156748_c0_seq1:12-1052(-)